ncbi:MAG TPA: acyl-CoA reductase [Gemmatimonadota bacterium]|nr:acyl-CoA reductase [Gemmatimonadota bacterium]
MSPEPHESGPARARCAELARAGEALRERPVREIAAALETVAARWRDPADSARREGEEALAVHHGVPERAIAEVLDAGFAAWTAETLLARVDGELGDARALDGFVELGGARRRAVGPRLAVALASRGVPTTPVGDMIDLLTVKSPVWLKPATGADDLAARFAATLREVDPGLGAAIEVATWPVDSPAAAAALGAADLVVATGRGETLAALRTRVPEAARLVAHGPRLSAAVVTREALAEDRGGVVAALADDVAFAGQAGCLSPVVAWIEGAGGEELAEAVLAACEDRWPAAPRRESAARERAAWAEWFALAGVERAAGAAGLTVGDAAAGWSVQWRVRAGAPEPPPAPRILILAPVERAEDAADLCERRRGLVAAVGVAGPPARVEPLAAALALAGVERVAPLGRLQRPPADWRRDGRPGLVDLVRWVDWEA